MGLMGTSPGLSQAMASANRTKWACAQWKPSGRNQGTMTGWLESFQAQLRTARIFRCMTMVCLTHRMQWRRFVHYSRVAHRGER